MGGGAGIREDFGRNVVEGYGESISVRVKPFLEVPKMQIWLREIGLTMRITFVPEFEMGERMWISEDAGEVRVREKDISKVEYSNISIVGR